ncbi:MULTISPECIES: FecCD family ABC transporter permease [Subtercola]|uniref:Iron ABC transporter permease n=1 Tax=Subtercola vilae TaxID=2056433 RepID=A0A4T2C310_9MICO|nr:MULTISPECIES: iron chelate uptake ABC transporter family permease subunit [Subtercola]MEA9984106.1 iron chelate uptake ABC transporter family permease subunit [Subtercola sp. RTI3]TIH38675.1 iron ABC transporter permease [Subtercola vilae]
MAGGHRPTSARRRAVFFTLAVVALVVVCALSLAVGARSLSPGVVLNALTHYDPNNTDALVVVDKRIPRTLIGLLAGGCLALGGAVMQGLTRNPLADPGILGVNFGAALAAVVAIAVFGVTSPSGYLWFAFAGAALASVLVYVVASGGREGATPVKLALAGAAVSAALGSVITAVQLTNTAALDSLRFWQVGSLAGRGTDVLTQVAPLALVGVVLALGLGRTLNGLALGDDLARGLGQKVAVSRLVGAVAVVLLCGSATAAVGPLVFVGLVVPHVARYFAGPDYRFILPFSLVLGPVLLLGADVIGRVVALPGELQVGIVIGLVGAPFFIALVRRTRLGSL